jgi:hypothetical protein
MSGAFQTSRELFDNPIWKNIVEFRLFFLIYGRAVFSEDGVRLADDLILKRGEWCRSTRKLQEDLQYIENRQVKTYSTSVINRCIKRLEKSQRICTRIHELGTVFTVVNYEQYQGFEGYKKTNLEQDLEQSGNIRGTVEEQSGNNNKKENKEKKVKKDKKDIIPKINFAEFVSMTQEEYDKLLEAHGQDKLNRIIETLDNYKGANNKKYASDYRAILTWVIKRVEEDSTRQSQPPRQQKQWTSGTSGKPKIEIYKEPEHLETPSDEEWQRSLERARRIKEEKLGNKPA